MEKPTSDSVLFYEVAKKCLNKSQVPNGYDPVLGCAISLNTIHKKTFGREIGGGSSTLNLYNALKNDNTFISVIDPVYGDIIISPTGTAPITSPLPHGHVGIVAKYGIMSNNSNNGLWEVNHSLESWTKYYKIKGGYPIYYFRKI